jgi:nucleotide-binding universal stress UspA family protein
MEALAEAMAAHGVPMSASQAWRICKALDLKPWQVESWMTSHDPDFWEKASDVCGLYLDPPENAVVWSVDEKSGMQAKSRINPTKPAIPGAPVRREFEYKRNGTAVLFAALDVHDGGVAGWVTDSTKSENFVAFLADLVRLTPAGLDLHCIADNLSAHKTEGASWQIHSIAYRGTSFEELDLEAVLARHPQLALVDELAHANVPGAGHEHRWQDVEEILSAGIDVDTTLNVANIASLGPLVAQITGVRLAEAVPDEFLRSGELKLVDLEPAALRRRLAQGLVFEKARADAALSSYFRFANLSALQELASLWLDESVVDPVAAYLAAHGVDQARCTVVVVGLEGSPFDQWLIRYAGCVAEVSDARLVGIHVSPDDNLEQLPAGVLDQDRRLLEALGGSLRELRAQDAAVELVQAATRAGASQLVIGSRRRSRLSRRLGGSMVDRVLQAAIDLPVQLVNVGQPGKQSGGRKPRRDRARSTP